MIEPKVGAYEQEGDLPRTQAGTPIAGRQGGLAGRGNSLRTVASRPSHAARVILALCRGWRYRAVFRLLGRRFSAGRNFRVFGRIDMRGPGEVSFGDDVVIHGKITPWTHSRQARIQVGNRAILDGVRFGCAKAITIGDVCNIATCEILDTDFHSTRADRRGNPDAPVRVAPVVVEDNVWIAAQAALLPGTVIGRNSVVGYGAVCIQRYPPDSIIFGNPAKKVAPVISGPRPANQPNVPRDADQ